MTFSLFFSFHLNVCHQRPPCFNCVKIHKEGKTNLLRYFPQKLNRYTRLERLKIRLLKQVSHNLVRENY